MEIEAATVAQVRRTSAGKLVAIDDDVQGVVRDLKAIDEALHVRYDPQQDFFVVYEIRTLGDGSTEEHFVTTTKQLDQRVVQRIREIAQPGYDYGAELERVEAAARKAAEGEFSEKVGPLAEELRHAMRKDLGVSDRIFVPGVKRGSL